jgi:hypothetical protein
MDWTGHCLTQTLHPTHLSLSTSMPNGFVETGGSLTYLNLLGLKDPDIPNTPSFEFFPYVSIFVRFFIYRTASCLNNADSQIFSYLSWKKQLPITAGI